MPDRTSETNSRTVDSMPPTRVTLPPPNDREIEAFDRLRAELDRREMIAVAEEERNPKLEYRGF